MGAEYQKKLGAWRNPQMNLKSLVVEKKMNRLTAVYDMPGVGAELNLIYTVAADGALHVSMEMNLKEGSKAPHMLRYGMLMQLPYDMDKSVFYGRGPIEAMLTVSPRSVSDCMSRRQTNSSSLISAHRKLARRQIFAGGSRRIRMEMASVYSLMRLHSMPAHCIITSLILMKDWRNISVTAIRYRCQSTRTLHLTVL